jgi:thiol-disulfide isomerase/thioredoxin
MNRIIPAAVVLFFTMSLKAQYTSIPVGRIANQMFFSKQHGPVFEPGFKAYNPDKESIEQLKKYKKHLSFKCVLGFWCDDSKAHVPSFLKIMQAIDMDEEGFRMYGVDENKQAAFEGFNALRIEFVPTVIVYFDKQEIGRWVESPKETLEKDLANILQRYLNK